MDDGVLMEATCSRSRSIPLALLLLLLVLVVLPIFGIAFISDDDLIAATARLRPGTGGIFWHGWNLSKSQGRFYQIFPYVQYELPYMLRSLKLTHLIQMAGDVFCFLSFFALIAELELGWWVAAWIAATAAAWMNTEGPYNEFHSYPLWYQVGLPFVFFSVIAFIRGTRKSSERLILLSAGLFFVACLYYEVYIIYAGAVFAIGAFLRLPARTPWKERFLLALWRTRFHAAAALLYVALLFSFRKFYPSQYPNNVLSLGALKDCLRVIRQYSIVTLSNSFSLPSIGRISQGTEAIWETVVSCVIGLLVTYLSWCGIRAAVRSLPLQTGLVALVVAIFFCVSPSFPYALVEGYRTEVKTGVMPIYHPSFCAAFAWPIVIGVATVLLIRFVSRYLSSKVVAGAAAALFGLAAIANAQATRRFFGLHHQNRANWALVDLFLDQGNGRALEGRKLIISPTLWYTPGFYVPENFRYWSLYFSDRLGEPVEVVRSYESLQQLDESLRKQPVLGMLIRHTSSPDVGFVAWGPALSIDKDANADTRIYVHRVSISCLPGAVGRSLAAQVGSQRLTVSCPKNSAVSMLEAPPQQVFDLENLGFAD